MKAPRIPLTDADGKHIGWAQVGAYQGGYVTVTAHLTDPDAIAAVGATQAIGECELWP